MVVTMPISCLLWSTTKYQINSEPPYHGGYCQVLICETFSSLKSLCTLKELLLIWSHSTERIRKKFTVPCLWVNQHTHAVVHPQKDVVTHLLANVQVFQLVETMFTTWSLSSSGRNGERHLDLLVVRQGLLEGSNRSLNNHWNEAIPEEPELGGQERTLKNWESESQSVSWITQDYSKHGNYCYRLCLVHRLCIFSWYIKFSLSS